MIKLNRKEEKAILALIVLFIGIAVLCKYIVFRPDDVRVIKEQEVKEDTAKIEEVKKPSTIYVYITGEVKRPDVYCLESDARLAELVNKAGGFTENADTTSINLAERLKDEQFIHVASKKSSPSDNGNNIVKSSIVDGKININTATAKEIDEFLPGIGETLANNIVSYRTKNGKFKSIDDVSKVDGIGSGKRFEKIKDMIIVN